MKYLPLLLALLIMGCAKPKHETTYNIHLPPAAPVVADESDVEIIGFTQRQCDPCKLMKPEWEKVGAKVYMLPRYQVLAQKYNITETPTTLWLRNGEVVKRQDGYGKL